MQGGEDVPFPFQVTNLEPVAPEGLVGIGCFRFLVAFFAGGFSGRRDVGLTTGSSRPAVGRGGSRTGNHFS